MCTYEKNEIKLCIHTPQIFIVSNFMKIYVPCCNFRYGFFGLFLSLFHTHISIPLFSLMQLHCSVADFVLTTKKILNQIVRSHERAKKKIIKKTKINKLRWRRRSKTKICLWMELTMALVRVFFVPDAVSRASFTLNASNECDDCTDEIKQKKNYPKKIYMILFCSW